MNYLKISIGVFIALATSRFVPHPPNFTSLLALSFYIPAILGIRFIPVLVASFVLTDLIIGLHDVTFFTWGSIIFIGLGSKFFFLYLFIRVLGSLLGGCLFFIITNFGVWSLGYYGYTLGGLMNCYFLAIPFFYYTLISTFIFAAIIESALWLYILEKNRLVKNKK